MTQSKPTIVHVVGNRPQFIKLATLLRALPVEGLSNVIVHSGQHYDYEMSRVFFDRLEIPIPDYNLECGPGSPSSQTGRILSSLDSIWDKEYPDLVVVYGDTNTTLAGALSAYQRGLPLVHVEAGYREFAWRPEEINKKVSDQCANYCFCATPRAVTNLQREGIENERIFLTGDLTYDSFLWAAEKVNGDRQTGRGIGENILVTLHRAETVDKLEYLSSIVEAMLEIDKPLYFPIHPRTRLRLESFGLWNRLNSKANIHCLPPLGYYEFLSYLLKCSMVMTDSGGVTREAYYAGKRSVIMDIQTEYSELMAEGTAVLAGRTKQEILTEVRKMASLGDFVPGLTFGDGRAAEHMANIIKGALK